MTSPPLVLHVLHALHIGGMENGLVNLVNHMPAGRYRHAIACIEDFSPAFAARITQPDVAIHALHRSRIGVWRLRAALHRLCRALRPALVHTRNQSGLDALLPARLAGIRCVHSEHGWDVDNLDGRAFKPLLLRRLHRPLVDQYIAVSRDLARFLSDAVGVPAARVTQIYNGVDTTRFAPGVPASDVLPPGFRVPGQVLIGTVGRVQAVKDQATLLRAFAALQAVPGLPPLRLVVAGDGPLQPELRALAAQLGITPITAFTGATDRIADVLRSLDVFVLPSLNEGISNTILEAMASGLPVIATAVGGNVELVEADRHGALFDTGDVGALTALLADYAREPARRAAHGGQARAEALARFSLDAMVTAYAGVYDRIAVRA